MNKFNENREIIELQTKYETERKEEQIESLSQENAFQELKLKQSGYFLFGFGKLSSIDRYSGNCLNSPEQTS